jgi:phage gp36-like protein
MRAYYNANKITLDFQRPILFNPNITFSINSQAGFIPTPGQNTDTLEIAVSTFNQLDDYYLSYIALPNQPFLYLSGTDRLISSFEIPVLIGAINQEVINVANTTSSPWISDFIDAYGLTEAILITNPENSAALSPNEYKLLRAFEDAEALYNSYVSVEAAANNLIITAGKRRTILTFARYFLDSRCRRKVVTDDYNSAIKELENALNTVVLPPGTDLYDGSELAYASIIPCPTQTCGCGYYY